jgi:hypothetical protein
MDLVQQQDGYATPRADFGFRPATLPEAERAASGSSPAILHRGATHPATDGWEFSLAIAIWRIPPWLD